MKTEGEKRRQDADRRRYLRRSTDRMGVDQLQALLEASKMMNATLELDRLLSLIVALATHNLNAERGTLYVVDEARGEIWSKVLEGEEWLHIRLPLGKGLAGSVAQTGETINIQNAYEDPRFYSGIDKTTGYRTHTVLCLPIRNRDGKIIGVLQVLNKQEGFFTEDDERFLEAMSSHAAVAIENALLYKAVLAKRRLEHELQIAREIQQQLLPRIDATIGEYVIAACNVPCEEVGGDYYEVFRFGEQSLGLALGDVSGKGIPAALLMAATQAYLRVQSRNDSTPSCLVSTVNRLMCGSTSTANFVTLFYGVLDLPTGALTYVNAGHDAPILLGPGGTCQFLDTGGLVLGVEAEAPYDEGQVSVEPGSVLLLFTDGVTEALNEREEEFGLEQLLRLVTTHRHLITTALLEVVQHTVQRFAEPRPQYDDLTMLVIKRDDRTFAETG